MSVAGSTDEKDQAIINQHIQNELSAQLKLETGLSDSDESEFTRRGSIKKDAGLGRRSWIGPPVPKHRDGMGMYIPPKGGQALAAKDREPKVGSNAYYPNINVVMTSFPEWTLGERVPEKHKKQATPGPSAYNCRKEPTKVKGPTMATRKFPAEKVGALGRFGRGPASVKVSRNICTGPKYSMRMKPQTNRTMPGLTSTLVQDPDPKVPAPNYVPGNAWLNKPRSFGIKPIFEQPETPGPKYDPYKVGNSPAWHLGLAKKQPKRNKEKKPAPNHYNVPSSIGDGPKPSMAKQLHPNKYAFNTPGPDQYNRAGFNLSEPGYTMKYRWFDTDIVDRKPAPNRYKPKVDFVKERPPAFSFPKTIKFRDEKKEAPSPAKYNLAKLEKGRGPTIGRARHQSSLAAKDTPGPADYQSMTPQSMPRAPAYTMAGLDKRKSASDALPGPAAYKLKDPTGMGKSIGKRLPPPGGEKLGPGPGMEGNVLGCPPCQKDRGATLKSRHTPHRYLGLKTTCLESNSAPPAPLFG